MELEYKGKTKNAKEWAEITGIPLQTIYSRLDRGWSVEKALEQEPGINVRNSRTTFERILNDKSLDELPEEIQASIKGFRNWGTFLRMADKDLFGKLFNAATPEFFKAHARKDG